jgi:predicted nucleotidyltransferase
MAVMMMPMDATEQLIAQVVGRITALSSPARVIVFGSVAAGTATADSDLDPLVVIGGVADPAHKYGKVIYEAA